MEEIKNKVEKFDGNDFGFWKMQMEDYLYQKELHQPLFGLDKKPVAMTNDAWSLLDRKALGAVRMTLSKTIVFNVKEEKTTHSLMAALSKMYEQPSAANKVHLMKRLFKMEMGEGSRFSSHLNDFNSVTSQLSTVKIDFEDEVKALLILSQLPESWNGMVTTVSNSCGKEKLKLDDVVSLILTEEVKRISSGSETSTSGSALFQGRGRSSDKKKGKARDRSKSRPKIVCWNCDQEGHFKSDCPAPKKKGGKGNQKKGANVVADTDAEVIQDALVLSMDDRGESWVVDSGASYHATANKAVMDSYKQGQLGKVYLGDNDPCDIVGKGNVVVNIRGNAWKLKDVRHVPKLKRNLASVGQICDDTEGEVTFSSTSWRITKGAMVLARGPRVGTLYMTSSDLNSLDIAQSDDSSLWHQRLGHMSEKGMKVLQSKGKLPKVKSVEIGFCEDCIFGKQKRVSFQKVGRSPRKQRLDLVHSDVWGPAPVSSLGGSRYYVTFIDDHSRKVWVYFMKHKSETFDMFKKWKALVENETGMKLKCLRSDNGGEYENKEFKELCAKEGIRLERTVPRTPQQNGIAERMNGTLNSRARCMRLQSGLPE